MKAATLLIAATAAGCLLGAVISSAPPDDTAAATPRLPDGKATAKLATARLWQAAEERMINDQARASREQALNRSLMPRREATVQIPAPAPAEVALQRNRRILAEARAGLAATTPKIRNAVEQILEEPRQAIEKLTRSEWRARRGGQTSWAMRFGAIREILSAQLKVVEAAGEDLYSINVEDKDGNPSSAARRNSRLKARGESFCSARRCTSSITWS